MTLDEITESFELIDEWDDRYRFLIELGRGLRPLPEALRTETNKVRGCASQVWLVTHPTYVDGEPHLRVEGDSDAHIVRGLVAILLAFCEEKPARDFLADDPVDLFTKLGFKTHMTPQRANGFAAMVARLRREATELLSVTASA